MFHSFQIVNPDAAADSQGAQIWGNPKCSTVTLQENGKVVGEEKDDAACAAADPSYLNLARDASLVNADLNSQDVFILPGTYSRINMSMLGSQQGGNNQYQNTKWSYETISQGFASMITEWSGAIDPPLTLGEGERAVITLNYSLAGVVQTGLTDAEVKVAGEGTMQGANRYDDCNAERTVCINAPSITVTVTK